MAIFVVGPDGKIDLNLAEFHVKVGIGDEHTKLQPGIEVEIDDRKLAKIRSNFKRSIRGLISKAPEPTISMGSGVRTKDYDWDVGKARNFVKQALTNFYMERGKDELVDTILELSAPTRKAQLELITVMFDGCEIEDVGAELYSAIQFLEANDNDNGEANKG